MHYGWRSCVCIMTMHYLDIIAQQRCWSYCQGTTISPACPAYVKKYCDICTRGKPLRRAPHDELVSLPVPIEPWKDISYDFLVDLPVSNGYDAVVVFIDRLMKTAHLISCMKTVVAGDFARMFLDYVICLHGPPNSIVSDRGAIFMFKFWNVLSCMMGIKQKLSMAFHPQTGGQMERMNQTMEQYLRMYCYYK